MSKPELRTATIALGKEIARKIIVGATVTVAVTVIAAVVLNKIDSDLEAVKLSN